MLCIGGLPYKIEIVLCVLGCHQDSNMLPFQRLCQSIVHQQLSGKAASTIWRRFCALFSRKSSKEEDGNDHVPLSEVTAERLLRISEEKLRSVGLSERKAKYVHNVAKYSKDG